MYRFLKAFSIRKNNLALLGPCKSQRWSSTGSSSCSTFGNLRGSWFLRWWGPFRCWRKRFLCRVVDKWWFLRWVRSQTWSWRLLFLLLFKLFVPSTNEQQQYQLFFVEFVGWEWYLLRRCTYRPSCRIWIGGGRPWLFLFGRWGSRRLSSSWREPSWITILTFLAKILLWSSYFYANLAMKYP